MKGERIYEIDVAKGIGILLVIIGHALAVGDYARNFIYSFHMPLFFILSGMVMKKNEECGMRLLIIKEKKLFAAYALCSSVYILYDFIFKVIIGKQGLSLIVNDLFKTCSLFGINVLWFISTLMIARIVTNILVVKVSKRYLLAAAAFLMLVAGFSAGNAINGLSMNWMLHDILVLAARVIVATGYIMLGHLSADYYRNLRKIFGGVSIYYQLHTADNYMVGM